MGQHLDLPYALATEDAALAPFVFYRSTAAERDFWPAAARNFVEAEAKRELLFEDTRKRKCVQFAAAFAASGIDFLFLKGSALAYQIFPEPWLRPRIDTDVLIRESDVDRVRRLLDSLGYIRAPEAAAEARRQFTYLAGARSAWHSHPFDIHWRTLNTRLFDSLWDFDELLARSEPLENLAPGARGFGAQDAFALACLHRIVHHHGDGGRLWLLDLRLLAERIGANGIELAAETAAAKGYFRIFAHSLAEMDAAFGTKFAQSITARPNIRELSAFYLRPSRRFWQDFALDLFASTSWSERTRYLRGHLFPPLALVQEKFPAATEATLPLYYAWRFASGAKRLLSRTLP